MEYIGEHLWAGQLGKFFILLAFVSSLLAAFSYAKGSNEQLGNSPWSNLGRLSFRVHTFGVIATVLLLFFMLLSNFFEYHYVWHHSSKALPFRYVFSSFWEGQEGSFLLWSFWHVVLGNILIKTARDWEAPVMSVYSLVQVFLSSMVLGVHIFDYKIGSNPLTILLREHPDFKNIPLFTSPDYLEKLDGRGLNPLLQNYWMTIHPPTLFLGFASTLVPFSYAVAALWKKRFNEWLAPVLPWAIFGVMILGTGILMGGAWAYEALSFGGFWAWDPVENASLVPWLTFVGALHTILIQRVRGTSPFSSFFLTIVTFIFILYSTFLTRSGILGETSVHAFTDLGMSGQLLAFLLLFFILPMGMLLWNYKKFPKHKDDDELWSREFWMFVGSFVLFLSAFQIIFETSKPVINSLFDTNMALSISTSDRIQAYHSWQIPLAIIVSLLMAFTQFLKYKKSDPKQLAGKITLSSVISLVIAGLISWGWNFTNPYYILLLFSTLFAVFANLDYFLRILKGKVAKAGASIAHIGVGLILLGALISTSKSVIISSNVSSIDISQLGEELSNRENILIFENDTIQMHDYFVTYSGKKKEGVNIYYEIEYFKDNNGKLEKEFTLNPRVQLNPRMGNVAEPDTRHFLHKDIYTHVTYAELEVKEKTEEEKEEYREVSTSEIAVGDSLFSSNAILVLDSMVQNVNKKAFNISEEDIALGASFSITDINSKTYSATPLFIVKDTSYTFSLPFEIEDLGLRLTFNKINTEENKFEITVLEQNKASREFIIMKAIEFPLINILWSGCILLIVGSIIAIIARVKSLKL